MASIKMNIADSADLIMRGIEHEFTAQLTHKLSEISNAIIKEIAEEAAKNVVDKVISYEKMITGDVVVQVNFNIKE